MPKQEFQKLTFGKLKAELFKSDCHPTHPDHIEVGLEMRYMERMLP